MAERIPNTTEGFSLSLSLSLACQSTIYAYNPGIGRFRLPTHFVQPVCLLPLSRSLALPLSLPSSASCCFPHGSATYSLELLKYLGTQDSMI